MSEIKTKLDDLLTGYSKCGDSIKESMLPGLSREEIKEKLSWFPYPIPEEVFELYEWHSGQDENAEIPFYFRDIQFIDIEFVKEVYELTLEAYDDEFADINESIDIKACLPFADSSGSVLTVYCDGSGKIVNIFEGIDAYFLSFEKMLDTCIEWVSQEGFDPFEEIPNEIDIWKKHNPTLEMFSG